MAVIKRSLKNILEENTMIFEHVPDIEGTTLNEDGTPRTWTIRPLTVAREHEAEKARLKNTTYLQHLIAVNQQRWKAVEEGRDPNKEEISPVFGEEDIDPLATAEQWGPIVAAIVAEPELDADDLIKNFHGLTLRIVGEEAEAFFREGPQKMKENREARRAAAKN